MKIKITIITILSVLLYVLGLTIGINYFVDFDEYITVYTAIFFSSLGMNFFTLKWRDNLIMNFIKNRDLTFLFILLSILYLVLLIVCFIKLSDVNQIMMCSICLSVFNLCIINYIYLK